MADDFLVDMTMDAAEIVFSHSEANRPHLDRKASPAAVRLIVPRGIPLFRIEDEIERNPFRCATASALVASKNVEAVIRACAKGSQARAVADARHLRWRPRARPPRAARPGPRSFGLAQFRRTRVA